MSIATIEQIELHMHDPKWIDEFGELRQVPSTKQRMDFPKNALHAAIRAFVYRRDSFTCQWCGANGHSLFVAEYDAEIYGGLAHGRHFVWSKEEYDGRYAVYTEDGYALCLDHRLTLAAGGTNHPVNLQVLCERCNCKKSKSHDRFAIIG